MAHSSVNMSMGREDSDSGLEPIAPPAPSMMGSKLDGADRSSLGGIHENTPIPDIIHIAGTGSISYEPNRLESSVRHGGRSPPRLVSEDISTGYLSKTSEAKLAGGQYTPQLIEPTQRREPTESIYGTPGPSTSGFEAHLVDAVSSSRRADDGQPALRPTDHADVLTVGSTTSARLQPKRLAATAAYKRLSVPVVSSLDARKLGIAPKRTLSDSKRHSHDSKEHCLETVDSSESDNSGVRSHYSTDPSSPDRSSPFRRHFDEHRSPGSLIALAAKNAERQLREQALSAFPNDDRRHKVVHYVDTGRSTPVPSSRASHHEIDFLSRYSGHWEFKENHSHHDQLDAERGIDKLKHGSRQKLFDRQCESSWVNKSRGKRSSHAEITRPHSPPMLGKDIVFPRSESPDPARFDVTQVPESLRKTMCCLGEQAERGGPTSPRPGGLWTPQKSETELSACWSPPVSRVSSCVGLWGGSGLDNPSSLSPPHGPSGLVTPRFEHEEGLGRFSLSPARGTARLLHPSAMLPPSPPHSASGAMERGFEERLRGCAADFYDDDDDDDLHVHHRQHHGGDEHHGDKEPESDDAFVTQVYNYLSLGSPAIAHDYDAELAKISRIPLPELRGDDQLARERNTGYLRLGPGEPSSEGVEEEQCARWRALRLYIREWERQRPGMVVPPVRGGGGGQVWGSGARKGSWAL